MKGNTKIAHIVRSVPGLERIRHLAEQLAKASVNSPEHRTLRAAIRVAAGAYRKTLDTEQATALHDAKPPPTVALGSLQRQPAFPTPLPESRRRIHGRTVASAVKK